MQAYLERVEGVPFGHYLPIFRPVGNGRNAIITKYFNLGHSYPEIVAFLASFHGVMLSVHQLKRILRRLGLGRRLLLLLLLKKSDVEDVHDAVMQELNGSGSTVGYRAMHQRFRDNRGEGKL